MALNRSEWIWLGGNWVRWEEATVHVSAHALHYGSSAFEGIRTYETSDGPAIFRLDPHIRRLFNSCKILRMDMAAFREEEVRRLCVDIVSRNRHQSCYIRPIVFRGSGSLGLNPLECPTEMAIFTFEWGRYLGAEAIEEGVDAFISSWRRPAQGTMAPLGKIGGQYVGNQFVSIEAQENGYTEGIMLDPNGYVCEGAGENLFMVSGGELITPPLATSLLEGVTRATVITLAQDLGLTVRFENVTRDMLYICDELFMTGTAAEISPVRSVDRIPVGDGRRGPLTKQLQDEFFGIVSGEIEDRHNWLTEVPQLETVAIGT
jgi:branched-chain amino acid aminotransferase